jgi:hypothetical protein
VKQSAEKAFGKDLGPVRKSIQRLDGMLSLWEESMAGEYLMALMNEHMNIKTGQSDPNSPASVLAGPVTNYRGLRKHILSIRSFSEFDTSRFGKLKRIGGVLKDVERADALDGLFPALLAQWRLTSSRVYNPSEDLELILVGTKLGDLTWKDAELPLDSFGITLPTPIRVAGMQVDNDFILVNSEPGDEHAERYIGISVFPDSLVNIRRTPQHVVQKAEADIKAGNITPQVLKLLQQMAENGDRRRYSYVRISVNDEDKVIDTLRAAHKQGFEQPVQIVAGLCLYLSSLKKGRANLASSWTPSGIHRARTIDERAITDESQICSVASEYVLTPELKTAIRQKYILRREGVEMPAGFVEAYYRRKKGTGHDPDAPRIEHVHSYSRGFDRLAEGTLPGGTQGKMKRRSKD